MWWLMIRLYVVVVRPFCDSFEKDEYTKFAFAKMAKTMQV